MNPSINSPLDVYGCFQSIKLHFSRPKYDFHDYGLNRKTFSSSSLEKKPDRYKYEKIWRRYSSIRNDQASEQIVALFVGSLLLKPTLWVGDIVDDFVGHEALMNDRLKYKSNYFESFKYDMTPHMSSFEKMVACKDKNDTTVVQVPKLIQMIPTRRVMPETVVILDMFFGIINRTDESINHPIWKSISMRLKKLRPFMSIKDIELEQMRTYLSQNL